MSTRLKYYISVMYTVVRNVCLYSCWPGHTQHTYSAISSVVVLEESPCPWGPIFKSLSLSLSSSLRFKSLSLSLSSNHKSLSLSSSSAVQVLENRQGLCRLQDYSGMHSWEGFLLTSHQRHRPPLNACSAPGGLFMRPHRARMGNKLLSELVMIKANLH